MQNPRFISKALAKTLHQQEIQKFGGSPGIRDEGLLDSALAQPQATFASQLLHPTVREQAAAYLYHLVKNNPFIDGNKRAGFAVMVAFLDLNGFRLNMSSDKAYNMVLQVACGEISKDELYVLLQTGIQPR